MDTSFLGKIGEKIANDIIFSDEDIVDLAGEGYKAFPISKENFHPFQSEHSRKKICFVDGGETCLCASPSLSIHFIRTFGLIIKKDITYYSKKSEFFLLVSAICKKDNLHYQTSIFSADDAIIPEIISIDSFDERIKDGNERGQPQRLSGIVRRLAELKMASHLLDKSDEGDLLILDGTLETKFAPEQKMMESLVNKALKHNALLGAIAKSCNMLTKKGQAVNSLLMQIGPKDSWYYYPILESNNRMHQAAVYFVKLNKKASHVFRFELASCQQELVDTGKVVGVLSSGSKDLILPGYPYGLIKTDKFARVTENEKDYLRTRLLSRLPKTFEPHLTESVHEILDSVY